jgi:hypothetical protein
MIENDLKFVTEFNEKIKLFPQKTWSDKNVATHSLKTALTVTIKKDKISLKQFETQETIAKLKEQATKHIVNHGDDGCFMAYFWENAFSFFIL